LSSEAVEHCVTKGLPAVVGVAEHLPFPSESFDLVLSFTVLLHLPPDSQLEAVDEMQRVCRPGGFIVLMEGSAPDPSPHVWTRSPEQWVALFDECSSVFAESHYFGLPLRLLWKS